MTNKQRMKVAMICHFSHKTIRERLPLNNRMLYGLLRKMLGMPRKNNNYSDIAPWDFAIINSIKERDDVELNVISAHSGLKRNKVSFVLDNIHYDFIKCEYATLLKRIISNDNVWRALNPIPYQVKRIIDRINPDIVLLVGAENAYYSSSILRIDKYPIYVLCQTIYNNHEFSKLDSKNASTELKIFEKEKYVGVYCEKHYKLLRDLGYNKYIFKFGWPSEEKSVLSILNNCNKKYDFINFAMHMSNEKGFPDCVKALAIVKKKYPNVSLNLIDGGDENERKVINELIRKYDLEDNVSFTPFFADRTELFEHIQNVRYAVLPCKVDNISGTQLQSMQYGLPVVCYETSGTPSLNAEKECVLIAKMNDIDDLAKKMLLLLENPTKAEELSLNSIEYSINMMKESRNNISNLVNNFKAIIDNYHNNTNIPVDQLFED